MRQIGYRSLKALMNKVYEDLNLQSQVRVGAVLTWMAEALEQIGATLQYQETFVDVEVKDHRIPLPCDFYRLKALTIGGVNLTAEWGTAARHYDLLREGGKRDYNTRNANTFTLHDTYIVTGRRSGKGVMYYYRVVLDEEGYPMVPDLPEYGEALLHYVVMKVKYSSLVAGRTSPQEHEYHRRLWLEAKHAARLAMATPSVADMEAMGRLFNRLVPVISDHYQLYRTSSLPQQTF